MATTNRRVLVVCQHFWPEAFRINDTCDYLVERGCGVDVLCGIPNYPQGKFYKGYSLLSPKRQAHNGVSIYRALEIPRGNNSNLRIFLNYVSFPLFSLFYIPRLLVGKYDKIYIHQLSPVMMGLTGVIIGRLKKVEIVMYVLDLWPENLYSVLPIKSKVLRYVAERHSWWYYKKADRLVALSEAMRNKLLQVTKKADKDIAVIPQACEKIYEKDIRDKVLEERFAKGFNAVFAGNLSPAQSLETIIKAARALKAKKINDINWIIIGDGMSRTWFEAEVKKAGLNSSFHFEGHKQVEDIPKYTRIADVLVGCLVKSDLLEATVPGKVYSYIAAGRPVVLAMDGEVQSLVNTNIRNGFAGPTEDAKAFARNIESVYNMSKKERAELGRRGRDYHDKYLDRDKVLAQLYDFMFHS